MSRRRKSRHSIAKKFTGTFTIALIILALMVAGSFFGLSKFKEYTNTQLMAPIQECVFLPTDVEMVEYSGQIGDISYSFIAPEYFKGNNEKIDHQEYFFANTKDLLKPAFYISTLEKDEYKNHSERVKIHQLNKDKRFWQDMKNNNHLAFFIGSLNETNAQNIMTIEHPEFCGNYFEFSCATMCDEKYSICEQVFDTLILNCTTEDVKNDHTYSEDYEQVMTTEDGQIVEDESINFE